MKVMELDGIADTLEECQELTSNERWALVRFLYEILGLYGFEDREANIDVEIPFKSTGKAKGAFK